ncbi:hypothetical protein VitviT2T_027162 [Vitis vinifera]|uniref:C2 NT-type domain-containing protein n=2 Tax=Vitis vinifera TaxID=29760 RepID=A0ABY9DSB7_VITVI|nr:uncharacterized protein LOC100255792 [Vitis vinifera]XP_059590868.1 uncharacterized protein LOC100255792 [Vitis vinifera]XP_059590869.1 uncharacterized protein LOC100255792 [Vitis vinifera]WKA09525.1 hypothetical protein VitviT2T_027162 [Vitis vinifera]|eukprot:XP_010664285.1 PREDICTED: centromere-associated protein E [Vitis vinifera]
MSKVAKWKLEKTKVKVVFRLQFHATHIPPTGWDKLFISFIPADSGKATAKTTKANVRNGTCKWADPIYETTRLLQDAKTKQYDEKLYKIIVAMGSSRSNILGEANINLADYSDAQKPSTVALPLHGCNSGTVLHVTVQLLTSKTGFREFEQQRELRERGLQTNTGQNRRDGSSGGKALSSEETVNEHMDKVNARVRFKPESTELPSLEEEGGLNEEYSDSAIGFDGSSNTSESLCAEKHDTSSTHEIDSLKSTISGDLNGLSHTQSPQTEKGDPSDQRFLAQGSNDWVHGWSSDYSVDNDLAIAYEENNRLRGSLEVAESSIIELKLEVSSLQSHADEIGVETQKFAKQLAAEIASGEVLAEEVSVLKLECSKLKEDLEHLRNSKSIPEFASREIIRTDQDHGFEDSQLRWLKGLLNMEDKIRELQTKACLGFHERECRFLQPDLEALLHVLQDLKQGTGQAISMFDALPSETANIKEMRESQQFVSGTGFDAELYQPEDLLHCLGVSGLVSLVPDSLDATNAIKDKFFELLRELDESKAERESLARKMDQMECYYEALVQELEENQKQMLGELQNLRTEHSTCMYTISSTKAQMETMSQDMNEQILRFAEDRRDLNSLNQELERRAITSEAALKRARLNYSIAVDQLQKDLELLSFQVLSMFETNEKLVKEAFSEASQPSSRECPETVQNQNLDSENLDIAKLLQCHNKNAGVKKPSLGGEVLLEDLKRSLHLQEELYQKVEEELCEMHLVNIDLDVFSKTLRETLLEASAEIALMKEKIDELSQQLELSTESKELLLLRLQTAMDDVRMLNEYRESCIAKCHDLALQNQILEANLESVSSENFRLSQKIAEWDALVMKCRNYESKYEACAAEKMELANLLKEEALENGGLQNEISSLQEELKTSKTELDELASVKESLQQIVNFLQDKLGSLLACYDAQLSGLPLQSKSTFQDFKFKDFMGVVLQLEELQQNTHGKILQLMKEKKDLEDERDIGRFSLSTVKSETLVMRQKFEHDIQEMVSKVDASNALVQRLQSELEVIANRLKVSFEAEEKYAQKSGELLSDFACLEVELQELSSKNRDLAQEILGLETVTEELGKSKSTIADITLRNQVLMTSLQVKTDESVKLASEISSLKESLRCLQEELCVERGLRDKLEGTVGDLTFQLDEKHRHLINFDQQNAELDHFKQQLSDLELEKSSVCQRLLHSEECLKKVHESSFTDLEAQLSEMHELLIATDVKFICTSNQYEACIEELTQRLQSSDKHLEELHKKHLDVETILNSHLAHEAHYIEENTGLLSTLNSLKSELEVSVAQNSVLLDSNCAMMSELEDYKNKAAILEVSLLNDRNQHAFDLEQLKHVIVSSEEEIDKLLLTKEELEIKVIVLKEKLDECRARITMLEGSSDELTLLRIKYNEITHRLSEQILKTEEFKNLSIHLRELKDKADAECLQIREKKEPEGPPVAMQDSLRVAFIKEQCETKLQELRHQLSISKKHGEEMLWKLQDAIDEIENRKKSEACHIKRNEELSLKILELEADLNAAFSEKREKINGYDRIKAEMECSLISLECCKEEKQNLENSLQECNDERYKIAVELASVKELLKTYPMNMQLEGNHGSHKVESRSSQPVLGNAYQENPLVDIISQNGTTGNLYPKYSDQDSSFNHEKVEDTYSTLIDEGEHSSGHMSMQLQPSQPAESTHIHGIPRDGVVDQENLPQDDTKHLALVNDHFRAQSLKSSMEHLHKELERMKNDNSLLPQDGHQLDTNFEGLQKELMTLHKANEELGSIFPLFNEFSGSGNALERVLALEIELAEALQAKKRSSIQFQSSFLKQHSDEAAVFQSFRDINELIKDMLELKGRYTTVETELKEMHDRYSQLSLQFAEVEGERQKLMMTLKNVRASKKSLQLNRLSSATP